MSAMFDDWAYHDVFEPPSPAREPPPSPDVGGIKDKPASVVVEVPEPEVKPRSSSISDIHDYALIGARNDVHIVDKLSDQAKEVPLSKIDEAKMLSAKSWLGSADPSVYDFDPDVWEMQTSEFILVKNDASLTMRLAENVHAEAASLTREIDWILHELDDTRRHDLATLYSVMAEVESLNNQRAELTRARQFLSDIWDENDQIARILRGPAPKAIPHLSHILDQAELARQLCRENPDFVDITAMEQTWRHNKQRALAIALAYISHEFRKITIRISASVKGVSGGAGAVQALIYTKFESDSKLLIPVIALLRKHSANAPEPELQLAWTDLQNIYFQLRTTLAGTQIMKLAEPLEKYTNVTDEFEETCRASLVQFRQMYSSEQQLFSTLFGKPTTRQFWEWLADSSDPLYATLRRIILHETNISKLCELVVIIGNGDDAINDADVSEQVLELSLHDSTTGRAGNDDDLAKPLYTSPLEAVQEDAQNRIVFRANIEVDILAHYEPSSKDFLRAQFPTIEKSLELLGQVYEMLRSDVFNELAHHCVRVCLSGLDRAVLSNISTSGEDRISSSLYHIKQLLVLQSRIVEFDLHKTVVQEVDFSGIQKLLESYRKGVPFRELILTAWNSVPKVVETFFNAMEEILSSLRTAVDNLCERFVSQVDFSLMTQSAAKNAQFREHIADKIAELKSKINNYISDIEVRVFLLDSIQEAVMDRYTVAYRTLSKEILETEAVMDIDTMYSWLSSMMSS